MAVDSKAEQLQIRFISKDKRYSVPDTPFAVPSKVGCKELNTLVNEVIQESSTNKKRVEFDFLINNEFLKRPLKEHLEEKKISSEAVIQVEYIERLPAPEPQDSLLHDDWVSSVHTKSDWILSGSYDNTVHVWTTKGAHLLTLTGHSGPVKTVSWVSLDDETGYFISGSRDQTVMLWKWKIKANKAQSTTVYKGHEKNIESVAVSPNSAYFASGGWDSVLKIWSVHGEGPANEDGESSTKKMKKESRAKIKVPDMTLRGHRDSISCVKWVTNAEILTSSWDHSLRLWDIETGGLKKDLIGNKAFFHCDYSALNRSILTASGDKHIRLYDPRSTEGTLMKNMFTSHTQWVQSVKWSKTEENLFISAGYDTLVKYWDWRSPKAPLYDLVGHDDIILDCDWSEPNLVVSCGADCTVRLYKYKHVPAIMDTD